MKTSKKLIILFIFLLFGGLAQITGGVASGLASTETGKFNAGSPRSLYLNNCARCHGSTGNADTELGRLNDAPDISGGRLRKWSDKRLAKIIANGKDSMPAFRRKFTVAQITSLVKYIREL